MAPKHVPSSTDMVGQLDTTGVGAGPSSDLRNITAHPDLFGTKPNKGDNPALREPLDPAQAGGYPESDTDPTQHVAVPLDTTVSLPGATGEPFEPAKREATEGDPPADSLEAKAEAGEPVTTDDTAEHTGPNPVTGTTVDTTDAGTDSGAQPPAEVLVGKGEGEGVKPLADDDAHEVVPDPQTPENGPQGGETGDPSSDDLSTPENGEGSTMADLSDLVGGEPVSSDDDGKEPVEEGSKPEEDVDERPKFDSLSTDRLWAVAEALGLHVSAGLEGPALRDFIREQGQVDPDEEARLVEEFAERSDG
jgi:hypothetical protein